MAQRRMFSPDIVSSDAFVEMPSSSQCLYFHLGIRADDDGFVNPRITMRLIGANNDDLNILIAKRFVLPFENGVIVIKHWRINNFIRNDRYKPTLYLDERARLNVKENMAYTLDKSQGKPFEEVVWKSDAQARLSRGIPDVIPLGDTGKDRLGKDRLGKEESGVSSIKYLSSIPEVDMKEFVARFDVTPSKVRSIGEDLVLYCQRKGKVYKNYKAFLLNVLKRDCRERPAPKPAPAPEKELTPEERERQAKKIKEIGDQVRGLAAAKKI